MSVIKRRRRNILIFIAVCVLTSLVASYCRRSHVDVSYGSGWLLIVIIALLSAFSLRKRLSFLPLLKARTWLQLHIYVGLFSGLLFLIHVGMTIPQGPLELTLAALFLIVFFSGILGLILSRTLPHRLTNQGEEIIFERIPIYRRQLRDEAESVVLSSLDSSRSKMLAEFYSEELAVFFVAPSYMLYHLVMGQRPLNQFLARIDNQKRYCNEAEAEGIERLRELVSKKYELDRSQCLQGLLKMWLFVHIPATVALYAFIILHVVLVYAYMGSG